MSFYFTLFLSLFFTSTIYANKIVANNELDGGAASHFFNLGQQSPYGNSNGGFNPFKNGPPSFLATFFELFANVSSEGKQNFFNIVKNENLTMGEMKTQLQAWANAQGKTEIFQNLTTTFEEKKAEFMAQIQNISSNSNLSAEAQALVSQILGLFNNEGLTREQLKEQLKSVFNSSSDSVKAELKKAFVPFFQKLHAKMGGMFGGFGQHGFDGFGDHGFGEQGFGQDQDGGRFANWRQSKPFQAVQGGNSGFGSFGEGQGQGQQGGVEILIRPVQGAQNSPVFTNFALPQGANFGQNSNGQNGNNPWLIGYRNNQNNNVDDGDNGVQDGVENAA